MNSSDSKRKLTFAIHLWRDLSCSTVGSSLVTTVPSLYNPVGKGAPTINLQVLATNRWTPSIPPVFHDFESLHATKIFKLALLQYQAFFKACFIMLDNHTRNYLKGPMNISYIRRESAPYSETTSSGFTTFPLLLLIL